ncbi:MAG: TadG family pilus assembly protein [Gemmatales bacterium]|nr:hypothetical protein [Gemmatales bacterium]MDW8174471.1 TadG family pilus assembly protein [Gemmatales bacterium]
MNQRRGTATLWVLLLLGVVLAVLVLACDAGLIWNAQAELRATADAVALAAAHAWAARLTPDGVHDGDEIRAVVEQEVTRYLAQAGRGLASTFLPNPDHEPTGDLVFGFYEPTHGFVPARKQDLDSPWLNAVRITLRRDEHHGNVAGLVFGPLLGWSSAEVQASAVAVLERHIIGFQCTDGLPIPLVPLAILSDPTGQTADCWESQLAASNHTPQMHDEQGEPQATVSLRLPIQSSQAVGPQPSAAAAGQSQMGRTVRGNACVLQVGTNSWAEIVRQTTTGVLPADLASAEFAGRFELDPQSGFRWLPAWAAAPSLHERELADWLAALSGLKERQEVRIWPLFAAFLPEAPAESAVGNGSEAPFQVAVHGFVAARILRIDLKTSVDPKQAGTYLELTLQPRVLVTRTAIATAPKRGQGDADEAIQNPYLSQPNPYLVRIKLAE